MHCIILDLVFIFHSLLYDYSPFLPVCIDNEFPLPDWFQRFGAVQTLSVLRLCRESLWRQVYLVLVFALGGGTERKVAFVLHCRRSCRLPSSNFPSVCMDMYRVNVNCGALTDCPFFFLNSKSKRTMWDTLFCPLKDCSTFCSVVETSLLRFNIVSSISFSVQNCEACILIYLWVKSDTRFLEWT
jgi:hypothetical protein